MANYWRDFYSKNNKDINKPSSFALWFIKNAKLFEISLSKSIYDIGCGNGRDSQYFMKEGLDIVSTDVNSDYGYGEDVIQFMGRKLRAGTFYSRFFLHSIEDIVILDFIKMIPKGSFFVAEYRVKGDKPKIYTNHKRNFIDQDWLLTVLIREGYEIKFSQVSKDLAPFKNENPLIGRVVAKKIC